MKLVILIFLTSLCFFLVRADDDYYFWNDSAHPYQAYYLEDYCGSDWKTDCSSEKHTVYLNSTGSGGAVIIRGFRASKPNIEGSPRCCITLKTVEVGRFNVQLDEIHLKQKKIGKICENFVWFYGLEQDPGPICNEVGKRSFKTLNNILGIEYVPNWESIPEFQKIKVVVTSTTNTNKMQGAGCDTAEEQWQCDNHSCIWKGFRCDAHNNCGDWSDELNCGDFFTHWAILVGFTGGIFVALLIWFVFRCCCCCCSSKKPKTPKVNGGFLHVTSLRPNGRPVSQEKLYPSFEVPYQNVASAPGALRREAPPTYSESALLSPASNTSYGTNIKS